MARRFAVGGCITRTTLVFCLFLCVARRINADATAPTYTFRFGARASMEYEGKRLGACRASNPWGLGRAQTLMIALVVDGAVVNRNHWQRVPNLRSPQVAMIFSNPEFTSSTTVRLIIWSDGTASLDRIEREQSGAARCADAVTLIRQ